MLLPIQQSKQKIEKTPVEEGRFGFGTTSAFDAFIKNITSLKGNHEILLAVNIVTLLRNNISTSVYIDGRKIESSEKPKLDAASVCRKTQQHMVEMANEFANVCDVRFKDRTHHVLFYLTDPTKQVPREWTRPHTSESATKLDIVTTAFKRVIHSGDQKSNNTYLHIRLADQMRAPSYRGIAEQLKFWAPVDVDIHLISHEPLDYHIAHSSGRSGFLYRSHTGAVIPLKPSELGKVVFKEEQIPFYPITHILLGDKSLIKGSLSTKERRQLIALAKENRWSLRTNEYESGALEKSGFRIPYKLT